MYVCMYVCMYVYIYIYIYRALRIPFAPGGGGVGRLGGLAEIRQACLALLVIWGSGFKSV